MNNYPAISGLWPYNIYTHTEAMSVKLNADYLNFT